MANVISGNRILPVWLEAVEYLEQNGHRCRNLLLEIDSPAEVADVDRRMIKLVDPALRAHCSTTVATVAGTIFPFRLYLKTGYENLPERFLTIMKRAKVPGHWGTYAMRLMSRPGKAPKSLINPLYEVVRKLKKASTDGVGYNSNYELGLHAPDDLLNEPVACEVPLYSTSEDFRKVGNYPCLSHLTFKLIDKQTIELTAIYRSHWYQQRALGNLVGLTHLMRFVAIETGLNVGRLTCISTDAKLDADSWGGIVPTRGLIQKLKAELVPSPAASLPQAQIKEACTPA